MMVKVFAIFELTVKKVKEPAFFILFIIAAFIGYFVSGMGELKFSQNEDILFGLVSLEQGSPLLIGFVVILLMTLIVAIFSGATDIPKDIDSRMIMLILGKPVKRSEYLLGKYLGIVAICLAFFFSAAIFAFIGYLINMGGAITFSIAVRQLMLVLVVFPFVAMAMMISAYLSDISAMIVAVVYVLFSICISAISLFIDMLPRSLEALPAIHPISYLFPNYFYFFNSFKYTGFVMVSLILYTISLTVIFLAIASFRLDQRDML
jgi:ABC-type transport system involved in multi-copper enzyme maturation permease subunit